MIKKKSVLFTIIAISTVIFSCEEEKDTCVELQEEIEGLRIEFATEQQSNTCLKLTTALENYISSGCDENVKEEYEWVLGTLNCCSSLLIEVVDAAMNYSNNPNSTNCIKYKTSIENYINCDNLSQPMMDEYVSIIESLDC